MSWQCRLIEEGDRPAQWKKPIGTMWYAQAMVEGEDSAYYLEHILSDEYKRDWLGKRPPIIVVLPSGDWFNVDSRAQGETHGWTVTGEAPNITVQPSINAVGRYHGWLQNGVLSDDCEGRTFPDWNPI